MVDLSFAEADASQLHRAAAFIKAGEIVAFPTETFYGLAVDPFSRTAVAELFTIKKRSANKPILVLIDQIEQLSLLVESIPPLYLPLIERYWPGPLTLIFPARKTLSRELTGGTETIGVRISSHPLARRLVRMAGTPITATSANISGARPPQTAEEVLTMFGDSLQCIVDGGKTPGGLSSTIVGLSGEALVVLRQGRIVLEP